MICVSIANVSFEECLSIISKHEMAEVRLDLLNFSLEQVRDAFASATIPLIATCRPEKFSEKQQLQYLKVAMEAGAKYVDIEYEAHEGHRKELIAIARKNNCEVIISYHNFENTPHVRFLQAVVNECFAFGADVTKIACMALNKKDNASILALYASDKRVIAFGMGVLGKISRIASLYMGAEFTYAALDEGNSTALGQYTAEQFRILQKHI